MFGKRYTSDQIARLLRKPGRLLKLLTMLNECTWECLAIEMRRRPANEDLQRVFDRPFAHRGIPMHGRPDNGPEFAAIAVCE
ncbi:transposase family protein [bacterium]|nr:transposase family protein [bacterium]